VVQNFSKALRIGLISFNESDSILKDSSIKRDESDSQRLTKISVKQNAVC